MVKKTCQECGQPYETKNTTQKFCGFKCYMLHVKRVAQEMAEGK